MKIYGNDSAAAQLTQMIQSGREPHSIIIHGEKGLGKKAMAKYIAASLMCESGGGMPCGKCKSCRMIEKGVHPDFITAKPNSNGNYVYSADDPDSVRRYIADAAVKPNEGEIKVYLIPDLDRCQSATQIAVQNIFLKLIEEPPPHAVIILTARSKETFLPTIISRTLSIGMVNVSERESAQYLQEHYPQKNPQEIGEAVSAGRGNIGRCEDYLNRAQFYAGVQTAREIARAAANGSEYEILRAFSHADGKKAVLREAIYLFSEIVRDSCVYRLEGKNASGAVGCDDTSAQKLSHRLTITSASALYDLLCEFILRLDANCSVTLTANSLAGQLAKLV